MLPSYLKPRRLTLESIGASQEIQHWLSQFSSDSRLTAVSMLLHLNFVPRDTYSLWLRESIKSLGAGKRYAIYAVRKNGRGESGFWGERGIANPRSAKSLGSEDLVQSVISNIVREDNSIYFDNPDIGIIRENRIHDLVLIEDSIGSGKRVCKFILSLQENPSFLSWWSFGLLRVHVISFSRPSDSESKIINKIRGSDHGRRKYRKSSKFQFQSAIVYDQGTLESRWGSEAESILNLCQSSKYVAKNYRLGYGDVMSNIVFYHSVPNNIPGILWCHTDKWDAIFKGRSLPLWVVRLIETRPSLASRKHVLTRPDSDIVNLLGLIKNGNRRPRTIALKLNCEAEIAYRLLSLAQELGLLSRWYQLTKAGWDVLLKSKETDTLPSYNRNLYIPTSWCNGRVAFQPPSSKKLVSLSEGDFAKVDSFAEGDDGESSLEISDARSATPTFSVMPQPPSMPRKSHDTDGPDGSKE